MRRTHVLTLTVLSGALLGHAGCALERLFPDDVGNGVARLTVRNAGALVSLVNDDARCGFASEGVLSTPTITGEPGGAGSVEWRVAACRFDLGSNTELSGPDCNGEGGTSGGGIVVVDAIRTVSGRLTGDATNPVIPAGPDSVRIDVTATFEDFVVEQVDDENVLTQRSGAVSFSVAPRLAEAEETPGVCAAPTPHARFTNVVYTDALVHVKTPDRIFEVKVPSSSFHAVNGVHKDDENRIFGAISLWDGQDVVVKGALAPDYDPDRFLSAFAGEGCADPDATTTLRMPLSFICEGVGDQLAPGVARLSVATLGVVAELIESDTACGFSSPSVNDAVVIDEDANGRGAAVWTATSCTMRFPERMVVSTGCAGEHTMASGQITVSATKRIAGRVTGHPVNPILPLDDRPAEIVLESVVFEGFRVDTTTRPESLHFSSGTASARITPRTAKSVSTGACSVPTPNARLDALVFTGVDAELQTSVGLFAVHVDSANLTAVNGVFDGQSNVLEGEIVVDGERYELPLAGDEGLAPGFDAGAFDASWSSCATDVAKPIDFASCDLEPVLISGAARLTVSAFGALASAIESDTNCGFASTPVLDAVVIDGELGRAGAVAHYEVDGCEIELLEPLRLDEDCTGKASTIVGRVTVSGSKSLRGISSGDPGEPIVPTSWSPATLELSIAFEDFSLTTDGRSEVFTVENGVLTGRVEPRTAIDTTVGACAIPLPIAALSDLAWSDAMLRIGSGDSFVRLPVSGSALTAQNGPGETSENHLAGTLVVGSESFAVPFDTDDESLDPSYTPESFLASFACTPNMQIPVSSSECSFNKTLGEGAARLIIQSVGEAASMVNADADCGFANTGILRDSVKFPADAAVGEMGSLTFFTEGCAMDAAPDGPNVPAATDCVGKEKYRAGQVTVTSTRVVEGELEVIAIFGITVADSIIPRVRDAVSLSLDQVSFTNFEMWSVRPDGSADLGVLEIESGTGSALVSPILGENADDPGVFMTPTPVSALDDVEFTDMTATLFADGKVFKLDIASTSLRAFNGSYQGQSNEIEGTIVVNGESIVLAPQALDPEFAQSTFDASYVCTENLTAVIAGT
jgi:hypothetical protein